MTRSLLTRNGGFEGSLKNLIETELAPFQTESNVLITSDMSKEVWLSSDASLTMGLALHELATNAAKYGALSSPGGQFEVSWHVANIDNQAEVAIQWVERGGPAVTAPSRRGFGTILIERSLVHRLAAVVQRDFLESGMHCLIRFSLAGDLGRVAPVNPEDEGGS